MATSDRTGTLRLRAPIDGAVSVNELREALLADRTDSWDRYEGRFEDLIAAELVRLDQLPGKPGRPKTACRYGPDGEQTRSKRQSGLPGGMTVKLTTKKRAMVYLAVSEQERERRALDADRRCREATAFSAELMLEDARRDMALADHQLATKCRAKLAASIREYEEKLRELGKILQPNESHLRLVHGAARGAT